MPISLLRLDGEIGDDAVQADDDERHRQDREGTREHRDHAFVERDARGLASSAR